MTFDEYERAPTTREGGEEYKTVKVKNYKTSTTGSVHIHMMHNVAEKESEIMLNT